jgi:hypothetical protein
MLREKTMKPRIMTYITAITVFVSLSISLPSFARGPQEANGNHRGPQLIEFDAPGAATEVSPACGTTCGTQALANNDEGVIVGSYTDKDVVAHGFLRTPDGKIIPFDAPGAGLEPQMDDGTFPFSINDFGVIAGAVQDSGNLFHGSVRFPDGSFTTFDLKAAGTGAFQGTEALDINLEGTTAGIYVDGSNVEHGFVRSRQGEVTTFDPLGSIFTMVCEETCLNPEGTVTGYYGDASGAVHGFLREPNGTIRIIDAPGSASFTVSASINPEGTTTGYYLDSGGMAHGYVRSSDGQFTTFDAPRDATSGTASFSINLLGATTGEFFDANSVMHGFSRSRGGTFATFAAPHAGTGAGQGTRPSTNNLEGDVAGWVVDGAGLLHGFVWTSGEVCSSEENRSPDH